jgi:SAM-dependent methyltransferase
VSDVERAATDREFLQQKAYADSAKLRARASIYAYRDPPGNFLTWVLGLVDWPDGSRAIDVGCGPGSYLRLLGEHHPNVRAIGVDLSLGMAAEAVHYAPAVNGDAAHLPLPDDTVDRVLAPHMLYHCPDIAATLRELRRVLRPGGVLVAVTNGADHLKELWDLHQQVTQKPSGLFVDRFDLATGDGPLREVFDDVRVEHADGTLLVPEPQPIIDYFASTFHYTDAPDSAFDEIRERVQRVIDADGVFHIRARAGAFICR